MTLLRQTLLLVQGQSYSLFCFWCWFINWNSGLDASIGFESNRPENVGISFVNVTLGFFAQFFGVYTVGIMSFQSFRSDRNRSSNVLLQLFCRSIYAKSGILNSLWQILSRWYVGSNPLWLLPLTLQLGTGGFSHLMRPWRSVEYVTLQGIFSISAKKRTSIRRVYRDRRSWSCCYHIYSSYCHNRWPTMYLQLIFVLAV